MQTDQTTIKERLQTLKMYLQWYLLFRYELWSAFILHFHFVILQEAVQETIPNQNAQAPPHIRILMRFFMEYTFLLSTNFLIILGLVIKVQPVQLRKNAFATKTGNMLVFLHYQCFLVRQKGLFLQGVPVCIPKHFLPFPMFHFRAMEKL